jgi:hypothetical protein
MRKKGRIKMVTVYCAIVLVSISPFFSYALEKKNAAFDAKKDIKTEWYFPEWLGTSPYSPAFEVRDTVNKYGRYADKTKSITIKDLIKCHGHFCGGLVESAASMRVAFDTLFPDKVIPNEERVQRPAESGDFTPQDIDQFQELQWAYARRLINGPLKDSFIVEELMEYQWPKPPCQDFGKRKDNDYKNVLLE